MMALLLSGTERPVFLPIIGRSTLVVDGQVLFMVLGRPSECKTFDDLVDKFVKAVFVYGKEFDRIDRIFHR